MLESLLVFILFNNKQKNVTAFPEFGLYIIFLLHYFSFKRKIYLEEMPEQS